MWFIVLLSSVILFCVILVWSWSQHKYSYFKRRNIPYLKPTFPIGNLCTKGNQENLTKWVKNLYSTFRDCHPQIGGIFMGFEPILVVTDLNLIKHILVANFSNFTDHGFYMNERDDPLSAMLLALPGERWRNMRTKLSPAFSNNHTKNMFDTVHGMAWEMLQFMQNTAVQLNKPFNAKYLAMRFICASIGSCGFGLDTHAFAENDPYLIKIAEGMFSHRKHVLAHLFLTSVYERLSRALRIKMFPEYVTDYFKGIIHETVRHREENQVCRNDFMNLLIQMKNKGCLLDDESGEVLGNLSYDELKAQAFVIFFAGFHTSRVTLSFALFELAVHDGIQERLREEVMRKLEEQDGGQLTYEALEGMPYLDQVIDGK